MNEKNKKLTAEDWAVAGTIWGAVGFVFCFFSIWVIDFVVWGVIAFAIALLLFFIALYERQK